MPSRLLLLQPASEGTPVRLFVRSPANEVRLRTFSYSDCGPHAVASTCIGLLASGLLFTNQKVYASLSVSLDVNDSFFFVPELEALPRTVPPTRSRPHARP